MRSQLIHILFLLAVIFFTGTSCNRVVEPEPLTKEDAIQAFNAMNSSMSQSLIEIDETKGAVAFNYLLEILTLADDTITSRLDYITTIPKIIEDVASLNVNRIKFASSSHRIPYKFNFDSIAGTLTWVQLTETWEFETEPEDQMIIVFPSTPDQEFNDATLTIWDYSEIVSGDDIFPTSLKVSLVIESDEEEPVNDEDKIDLYLDYNASVVANALENISLNIDLNPFTISFDLDLTAQNNDILVLFMHEFMKDDVKLKSARIETTIKDTTFINPVGMNYIPDNLLPDTLQGYLQTAEVKAKLDFDVKAFLKAVESNQSDSITTAANQSIKIEFTTYPMGSKIAKINWLWDAELDFIQPYLVFNDGTEIPSKELIPEFFNFDIEF